MACILSCGDTTIDLEYGPEWGYQTRIELGIEWEIMSDGRARGFDGGAPRDTYSSTWTWVGAREEIQSLVDLVHGVARGQACVLTPPAGVHPFGPLWAPGMALACRVSDAQPVARVGASDLYSTRLTLVLDPDGIASADLSGASLSRFLAAAEWSPDVDPGWGVSQAEEGWVRTDTRGNALSSVATAELTEGDAVAAIRALVALRAGTATIPSTSIAFPQLPDSVHAAKVVAFSFAHDGQAWEVSATFRRIPSEPEPGGWAVSLEAPAPDGMVARAPWVVAADRLALRVHSGAGDIVDSTGATWYGGYIPRSNATPDLGAELELVLGGDWERLATLSIQLADQFADESADSVAEWLESSVAVTDILARVHGEGPVAGAAPPDSAWAGSVRGISRTLMRMVVEAEPYRDADMVGTIASDASIRPIVLGQGYRVPLPLVESSDETFGALGVIASQGIRAPAGYTDELGFFDGTLDSCPVLATSYDPADESGTITLYLDALTGLHISAMLSGSFPDDNPEWYVTIVAGKGKGLSRRMKTGSDAFGLLSSVTNADGSTGFSLVVNLVHAFVNDEDLSEVLLNTAVEPASFDPPPIGYIPGFAQNLSLSWSQIYQNWDRSFASFRRFTRRFAAPDTYSQMSDGTRPSSLVFEVSSGALGRCYGADDAFRISSDGTVMLTPGESDPEQVRVYVDLGNPSTWTSTAYGDLIEVDPAVEASPTKPPADLVTQLVSPLASVVMGEDGFSDLEDVLPYSAIPDYPSYAAWLTYRKWLAYRLGTLRWYWTASEFRTALSGASRLLVSLRATYALSSSAGTWTPIPYVNNSTVMLTGHLEVLRGGPREGSAISLEMPSTNSATTPYSPFVLRAKRILAVRRQVVDGTLEVDTLPPWSSSGGIDNWRSRALVADISDALNADQAAWGLMRMRLLCAYGTPDAYVDHLTLGPVLVLAEHTVSVGETVYADVRGPTYGTSITVDGATTSIAAIRTSEGVPLTSGLAGSDLIEDHAHGIEYVWRALQGLSNAGSFPAIDTTSIETAAVERDSLSRSDLALLPAASRPKLSYSILSQAQGSDVVAQLCRDGMLAGGYDGQGRRVLKAWLARTKTTIHDYEVTDSGNMRGSLVAKTLTSLDRVVTAPLIYYHQEAGAPTASIQISRPDAGSYDPDYVQGIDDATAAQRAWEICHAAWLKWRVVQAREMRLESVRDIDSLLLLVMQERGNTFLDWISNRKQQLSFRVPITHPGAFAPQGSRCKLSHWRLAPTAVYGTLCARTPSLDGGYVDHTILLDLP